MTTLLDHPEVVALRNLKTEREKLASQIRDNAKVLFRQASGTLFTEYPNLIAYGWTQYTPYFNDGDTCEFGSNHDDPGIVLTSDLSEFTDGTFDIDEFDIYDFYKSSYSADKRDPADNKAIDAVREFLRLFDDDDMYGMFGDHRVIKITRDGVEVEDYDHE